MQKDSTIMLHDVTLAAIVRDELHNPAGGIRDYVESMAPYFPEVAIVDTGSKDGTVQELDKLASEHVNLRVHKNGSFGGYDHARNFLLKKTRTKRVFFLDADERLTSQDFDKLSQAINTNPEAAFVFPFLHLHPNGDEPEGVRANGLRLFPVSDKTFYVDSVFESIPKAYDGIFNEILCAPVHIKHFLPSKEALEIKEREWYHNVADKNKTAPSECPSFNLWKAINPLREKYRF